MTMIKAGLETCTSSTCPAADWEKTLSLYSVRLATKYQSPATVRTRRKLIDRLFYLYGWRGLLHSDPHDIAAKHYAYLSEPRRRIPASIAAGQIEDFRDWYNSQQ